MKNGSIKFLGDVKEVRENKRLKLKYLVNIIMTDYVDLFKKKKEWILY